MPDQNESSRPLPLLLTQTIKDDDTPHDFDNHGPLTTTTDDGTINTQTGKSYPVLPDQAYVGKHKGHLRYNIESVLGSGGGGIVYSADDLTLGRSIALKFTPKGKKENKDFIKKFIREATLTSILEHPHIPPIYDLGKGPDDLIYYSMKKISGRPLSSFIVSPENPEQKALPIPDLISVIIKASQAAAYAHHKGIIHRDIKPENIMMGDHGEVYLVDWGIAISNEAEPPKGKMAGTPVYMSPEQARKEMANERSDVYCMGATLYHALYHCLPFDTSDAETFWNHKRKGIVRPPPAEKKFNIPPDLHAICIKCLSARPEDRYPDMKSLIDDLTAFQSGAMVKAYRYSIIEALQYHMKKSSRHIIWMAFLLLFLAGITHYTYRYYQLEIAGWGKPIYTQGFSDGEAWKNDWLNFSQDGELTTIDGRLVSQGGLEYIWFYSKEINGGAAIEFEGEVLPGAMPGDLSIVYTPDLFDTNDKGQPNTVYYLQHGAKDNSCSIIEGPTSNLDYHLTSLESGVVYKIRGEVDGKKLLLYLNGKLICNYDLLFPLNSGYIGLYSYYDGKAFDNIKIYNKELPQLTSITATGDMLYQNKEYELAIERYAKISENHHGTELGDESLFKTGLCYLELDEREKAFETWANISSDAYDNQIYHYRWIERYRNREFDQMMTEIREAYQKTTHKNQIRSEWAYYLHKLSYSSNVDVIRKFLQIRDDLFPGDQVHSYEVLSALKVIGETNRALVMFPEQDHIIIQALMEGGRYNDIIQKYSTRTSFVVAALFRSGQYDKIIEEHSDRKDYLLNALIASGQLQRAMELFSDNEKAVARIIQAGYGDFEHFVKTNSSDKNLMMSYLLRTGQEEKYLELARLDGQPQTLRDFDAELSLALKDYFAGAPLEVVQSKLTDLQGALLISNAHMFTVYFLYPVLAWQEGNEDVLHQQQQYIQDKLKNLQGMRPWYCSKLLDGKISKSEFMRQPKQSFIEQDFLLFTGLHHDLRGRKRLAAQYYQQCLDVPKHKYYYNVTLQRFLKHRIKILK